MLLYNVGTIVSFTLFASSQNPILVERQQSNSSLFSSLFFFFFCSHFRLEVWILVKILQEKQTKRNFWNSLEAVR